MRPEFSRNPLGTGKTTVCLSDLPSPGAGFGWSVCALMDVTLIVQVEG